MSCRDGHLVDPDRVDDDPQDREETERGALGPGKEGLPDGHPVDRDGDHDAYGERYQRRYPGGDPQRAEQDEEQEQWQCRNRGAPREGVGDRIKNLLVHGLASIVTSDTLLEIPYCIPSNAASRWPIRARAGSCSSRSRSGCRAVADGGARDRPARTRPDWGRRHTRPNRRVPERGRRRVGHESRPARGPDRRRPRTTRSVSAATPGRAHRPTWRENRPTRPRADRG